MNIFILVFYWLFILTFYFVQMQKMDEGSLMLQHARTFTNELNRILKSNQLLKDKAKFLIETFFYEEFTKICNEVKKLKVYF